MEYRILEAAKMLGLSKNTIKYRMKKLPESMYRKSNDDMGTIYISEEGLEELRKMGETTQQTGKEPPTTKQEADKPDNEPHDVENNEAQPFSEPDETEQSQQEPGNKNQTKPDENRLYTTLLQTVELLQEQLATKDRQIETLTEALLTAQRTAEAAQALHAGTIQQQLEAQPQDIVEDVEEPEREEAKEHWWKRIFGR